MRPLSIYKCKTCVVSMEDCAEVSNQVDCDILWIVEADESWNVIHKFRYCECYVGGFGSLEEIQRKYLWRKYGESIYGGNI